MKRTIAALAAGVALGGTGTALAVTTGTFKIGHGSAATFTDLPNLFCVNKKISDQIPGMSQAGSVAVICTTSHNSDPDYTAVFEWNRLSVFYPNGHLALRRRLV